MSSCNKDIAVIGMAFRFPGGVKNEKDFWSLLDAGRCAITEIPSWRWPTELFQDDNRPMPGKCVSFSAGVLDNIRDFDASFFGISPKEAEWLDPQQRFLLKVAYECLEDANIKLEDFRGSDCGVYTGISSLDYLCKAPADLPSITAYTMTGNTLSIASNRLSYVFDLHGPSVSMDTACSSSLVTLHHACQAVRSGEVPYALVASAHLLQDPYSFMGFSKASMLSATGTCRPFDERANGYVRSEGATVLLIKPLEDAIRDHNKIHAVIKATGVNTDGSRKKGLTIPSEVAQTQLMREVLAKSGISVNDIDFIEAHGTGTPVGDPIEVRSISSVYTEGRNDVLPITSVKGNLGHMEPMSGLAGFVKTVLSLRHEKVPPVPFDLQPSSKIDFDKCHVHCYQDGFKLPHRNIHTAGINSFGFGGANAHVIVQTVSDLNGNNQVSSAESAAEIPPLFISAKTKDSLKGICSSYADALSENGVSYYDFAYTAAYARDEYEHKLAVTGAGAEDIINNLREFASGNVNSSVVYSDIKKTSSKVAFVFNGNGSQYAGMGRTLYAESRLFALTFDKLADRIEPYLHYSLKNLVTGEPNDNEKDLIQDTKIAQTLIFVIQVCLAEMLKSTGITPKAVVGHSMGEIAASYVAGLLDLDEAVKVICVRSMLQDRTRGMGKMAAVSVSEDAFNKVKEELAITDVDVAAINSSDNITISGNEESILRFKEYYASKNIFFRVLNVDYPFHSSFMNMIEKDVLEELKGLGVTRSSESGIAYYSAVQGCRLADNTPLDNEYWWHNIREKVQFCQAVSEMIQDGCDYLLEIGSNAILQRYLRDISKKAGVDTRVAGTLLANNDNLNRIRHVALECHLAQHNSDKSAFFSIPGNFVDLPHYCWDEKYFGYKDSPEKPYNQYRVSPLLGWPIQSTDPAWQNLLEPAKNSLLRDHVVDGECVYAAADFIETALEGAVQYAKGECVNIEHLDILSSLVFDKENYKNLRFRIVESTLGFDIKTRDYMTEDEWVHNAKGRILVTDDALIKVQENYFDERLKSSQDNGIVSVSREEIYQITESLGLIYGEQFALVDHIDICGDSLKIYLDKESLQKHQGNYVVHPGILDAGFHALFALKQLSNSRTAYLPVKFGRISVMKDADVAYLAARVLRTGARSILAGFQMFDASGRCVGLMQNCRFNMMPKMEANSSDSTISSWYYDTIVAPHSYTAELTGLLNTSVIAENLVNAEQTHSTLSSRRKWFEKILPLMEQSVLLYGITAVKDLMISDLDEEVKPVTLDNGEIAVPQSVLQGAYCANPLYKYIKKLLEDRKLIRNTDDGVVVFPNMEELGTGDDVVQYAYHLCPEALPDLLPVYRIGNSLTSSLEDFSVKADIINNSRSADAFIYEGVRDAVADLIKLIKNSAGESSEVVLERKLRVLSLGSGNLRLNDVLENTFKPHEYVEVVALSEDAVSEVVTGDNVKKAKFNSDTLEVELNMEDPNVPAKFDLIVVEESLFKAVNHLAAIQQLKSLLAPSGILVVMERYPDWSANFCNGLREDWWQLNDVDEEVTPLKTPKYWQTMAGNCFKDVSVYHENAANGYQGGMYLVLARNKDVEAEASLNASIAMADTVSSSISAGGYMVLTDTAELLESSVITNLREKLSEKGVTCETGTVDGFISTLKDNAETTSYHDFVYIASAGLSSLNILNTETDVNSSLDGLTKLANCLNHQVNSKKKEKSITLTVITINGSTVDYAKFDEQVSLIPQQSAILGLSRVVKSESEGLRQRSLDLIATESNIDKLLDKVVLDLLYPDVLDEVIITSGNRYRVVIVNRKQYENKHAAGVDFAVADDQQAENYYLDFTSPGRLRNLCWKPKHLDVLRDNDIEVDVKVTGLNFRDIMLTMGLVPDDALENGFSGPALGLEFAGVVSKVGSAVTEYKAGDRVLGFGSACFSNKLVVPDYAVAPVPDDWSLDSAATAPIVFFTAWYAIKYLSRMEKGESILIHGAAGGVGIAAIQIANHLGLEVYATAGSDEKRDFLKMLGVKHTYNSRSLDFCDEVMKDTAGTGVDAVLNCLSGEAMRCSLTVLKPFGRFMELGKRDFVENTSVGLRYLKENISYFAIDVDQLFKVYPQRAKALFHEVIGLFASGDFSPLPFTRYSTDEVVNAFRFMQQGGQIGKVTVNHDTAVSILKSENTVASDMTDLSSQVFSSDDTWLITGGTGGFGFATAKYLISQGIRKLVLVSRSGIKDESVLAEVKELTAQYDLRISVEKCDVADYQSVADLWERLKTHGIKVDGIIHAAAVFADTMLSSMNEELFARVINPKFKGAYNLHKVSLDDGLKYFVVYSSISVAIGNIGQANYVAANSGLEGITAMRLRQGLHSACIEWGPINDIGYLSSRTQVKKSLESVLGSEALSSSEALSLLPKAISRGGVSIYANLNWAGVADTSGRMPMRVYELVLADKNKALDTGIDDLTALLAGKGREESLSMISDMLVGEIADTMGLGADQISKDQNLQSIGLDSLMAMELIVSIEKKTRVKLSVMTFQDNPTVLKLAEKIYQKINGADEEGSGDISSTDEAETRKAMLSHLDTKDLEYLNQVNKNSD